MPNIDLSILICSLESRKHLLARLLNVLNKQKKPNIQIIIETDNGEKTIGQKRNILVEKAVANGSKYLCFIDDDDLIADDYTSKILSAIATEPDCCSLEGQITTNGKNPKKFIHSMTCPGWCEHQGIYLRFPNHLNCVKTEIAKQVRFPEINFGEDHDYSNRLRPLLKTEVYIEGIIYFYLFTKK